MKRMTSAYRKLNFLSNNEFFTIFTTGVLTLYDVSCCPLLCPTLPRNFSEIEQKVDLHFS